MTAEWVLGVDWYKRGWVGVLLTEGGEATAFTNPDLEALVAHADHPRCVGVDMPIGSAEGVRAADLQARAFVGPRRNSVFLTPPPSVLAAESYQAANEIAPTAMAGRKITRQAWALRTNIEAGAKASAAEHGLIEVHPEVSFRELHGEDLAFAKTTWNGQHLRRRLLAEAGIELPETLDDAGEVPVADLLDAAVAAWSAQRYARGQAISIPPDAVPGSRETIWR